MHRSSVKIKLRTKKERESVIINFILGEIFIRRREIKTTIYGSMIKPLN